MIDSVGWWERETVAAAVDRLLVRTRSGRGGALFVLGSAGLGKTTCLRRAGAAAAPDHEVGEARGDEMESGLPFGLVSQALDALGCPDVVEGGFDAPLEEAGAARAARFYRVLRWVREAATPLMVVADDLHWADPDSLALLTFLCRRSADLPLAVVGALRPFPPEALRACEALDHDGRAEIEVLAPLSRRSAGELLASRAGRRFDDEVVRTAWTSAGGNPLLLEQLARTVDHDEDLTTPALGTVGGGSLLTRFAGLPDDALRVARAASVLGVRFAPELATVLAGVQEQPPGSATEALCRSGLFGAAPGGALEFVHPLFRQALYDEIPAAVRARLHASAFAVLHARGRDAAAAEHAPRADLSDDPAVVEVLTRAGTAALRAGALATAAQQLQAAVALAGDRPDPGLLLALGEALLSTAAPQRAVEVYDRVLADPAAPVAARADALRMSGRAHTSMAAYAAASARFAEAVELIVEADPASAIEALLDEAMASWATVGPVTSLPLVCRARDLARGADPALRRRTAVAWAFMAVLTGDGRGVAAADVAYRELALDPAAQLGDLSWVWGTIVLYGHMLSFTERQGEAERVLAAAAAAAEHRGAVEAVASLAIARARLCHECGRLDEALAHARRAGELAELVPMLSSFVDVGLLAILYELDRDDEAEAVYRRIATNAGRGEFGALVVGWSVQARRLFDAGAVAESCELFDRVQELCARLGFHNPCIWYWARYAVSAYVAGGRIDDARHVVSLLECSSAGGLSCRWPQIAAHAGRAALAEAAAEFEEADRHHRAALARHEEVEVPLERVETLLAFGAFLRRRGQPGRARPVLADALGRAQHLGAVRLAAVARDELKASGGRRHRGRCEELTGQELRVARLGAAGLANREIATVLSITTRTVEYHLGHAYSKLGLRSRRELILRADQLDLGPLGAVTGTPRSASVPAKTPGPESS